MSTDEECEMALQQLRVRCVVEENAGPALGTNASRNSWQSAEPNDTARYLAAANYGAMTKRRPYSAPLDLDAALGELERNRGTQFDGDVVDALVDFVRVPEQVPA